MICLFNRLEDVRIFNGPQLSAAVETIIGPMCQSGIAICPIRSY